MSEEVYAFPMKIEEAKLLREALSEYMNAFYIGMGRNPRVSKKRLMEEVMDALDEWIENRDTE